MKKISDIMSHTNVQLSKLMSMESMLKKIKHELAQLHFFKSYPEAYRVIKFSQGILYLSVCSAALATQFRHTTPHILRELQEKLPDIEFNSIQCKVSGFPTSTEVKSEYKKRKPKEISLKTREKLSQLSNHINSDALKEALKKLVQ